MNLQNLSKDELLNLQDLINKALEQPEPPVKDLEYMIEDIMNEFEFGRVEVVMEALDWKWYSSNYSIPTINELRIQAERLLRGAAKSRLGDFKDSHCDTPIINATGGFEARAWCNKEKTQVTRLDLAFVVTSWDSSIEE